MSSKSGNFWSFTMLRFRTSLLQLFQNTENCAGRGGGGGGGGRRRSSLPPQASVAVLPYARSYNQSIYPMFRFFASRSTTDTSTSSSLTREKLNKEKDQPPTAHFSLFPGWAKWIFGSLLSLLIPTWKQSWNKLQTLEEMVIEEAESVAEVVEKVAELTEKVSAEIAEKFPEKSKLKEAAQVVENYSKEIAHDAHLTQDILHKVEEWKQKPEKSETTINEQVKKKEGIANK